MTIAVSGALSAQPVCTLEIDADSDVSDLKWEIEKATGIPEHEQRLLLGRRVLVSHELLSKVFSTRPEAQPVQLVRMAADWVETLRNVLSGKVQIVDLDGSLRADKEIMLAAIRRCPQALQHTAGSLRDDRELTMIAVQHCGPALEFAAAELRADREVVLAAVRDYGLAIRYAAEHLQADPQVARTAVLQNGWAFELLPQSLQRDREIVVAALGREGGVFEYLEGHFQKDRELALIALRSDAEALRYMSQETKQDPEIVSAAAMGVRMRGTQTVQYFQSLLVSQTTP